MTKKKLTLEQLEDRSVPSTTAAFNGGFLAVSGDQANNNISVMADTNGNISVTDNGATVPILAPFGTPTRGSLTSLLLDGGPGNDSLFVDSSLNTLEANGSLSFAPSISLFGGPGDDVLQTRAGGIVGGLAGVTNGVVTGTVVGNAFYDGGPGSDTLISGPGNDLIFGGPGNDSYIWPPGTLTDIFDGGPGTDTATIIGNANQGDAFTLSASGSDVLFQRTNLIQFSVFGHSVEVWNLNPGSGDDTVTINSLAFTGTQTVKADGDGGTDSLFLNNPNVQVNFFNFEVVQSQ